MHIRYLGEQIEEVETELKELIEESPTWQVQEDLLCSTPGVAETTARTLLVRIPELGKANLQEIAKLVGLVPIVHESSTCKGKHRIEGGRADVRRALHMATLPCVQHNESGSMPFTSGLLIRARRLEIVLIVAARKLLVILNPMLKNQTA